MNDVTHMDSSRSLAISGRMFALIALCVTFVWSILSTYVLHIDAAGRIQILLLVSALVANIRVIGRHYLRGPLLLYLLISVYMFANGIVQGGYLGYEVNPVLQLFRKTITPPVFLLLCAYSFDRNRRMAVRSLLYSMLLYLLIFVLFKALGSESQINENEVALVMISATVLLCYGKMERLFSFRFFILIALFLLFATVIIGSRMGLAVVLFLLAVYFLYSFRGKSMTRLFLLLVAGLAIAAFLFYVFKSTEVGHRLASTTEQTDNFSAAFTSGTILDKFGDRGLQYFLSWPYFLESPVFGIGLNNWMNLNPLRTVCHSEYLVQYLENGLVAFIPYIIFLYLLIHSLRLRIKRTGKKHSASLKFMYLAMFGILFCNSVIWTNDQYSVFVVYALCYALSRQRRVCRIQTNQPVSHLCRRSVS